MSLNLRYPNITGLSEKEQLTQIKSYLHQFVEQLNNSLPNLGTGEAVSKPEASQSENLSYAELRSFVIQELQAIENSFEELSKKVQSEYVSEEELPKVIEDALTQAKESGEFDGEPGPPGEPGAPGDPGNDGFSPTVEVTKIAGGHRVTITDTEGTKTFDVMDGTGAYVDGLQDASVE